ncbi:hypothetical protein [Lacunimicrobium album]
MHAFEGEIRQGFHLAAIDDGLNAAFGVGLVFGGAVLDILGERLLVLFDGQ